MLTEGLSGARHRVSTASPWPHHVCWGGPVCDDTDSYLCIRTFKSNGLVFQLFDLDCKLVPCLEGRGLCQTADEFLHTTARGRHD